MNPRILLQIKSICGVVGRDSMLVFDEGCIRNDLWMKVHEKGEKIHILGIFGGHVPVHLEGVPVHPSRTQCVPVHVRGVPVHPVMLFLF